MVEEKKQTDGKGTEETNAQNQPKETEKNTNLGNVTEEKKPNMIDDAKKAAQSIKDATAAQKIENDRTERLAAESQFGGQAKMTAPVVPTKKTDAEYAQALMRGEVNPMKEDGFA